LGGVLAGALVALLALSLLAAEKEEADDLEEELGGDESKIATDFEKLPQSLFIEAEEMDGVAQPGAAGAGWQAAAPPPYTSRQMCRCVRPSSIERKIFIPAKATYVVWVRYLLVKGKQAPFTLRIEKDAKVVFQRRYYDFTIAQGEMIQDLQKERGLWFDLPGMQQGVFSGSEWAWEHARADLPQGEATLVIEAHDPSPGFSATLDAILLTASAAYHPTYSDFQEVWVRCRPIAVEPPGAEMTIDVGVQFLRLVILKGKELIGMSGGTLTGTGGPLRQGDKSTWAELHTQLNYGWTYCTVVFTARGTPPISKLTLEIDVAWGAREGQIVKTLRETADVGPIIGCTMAAESARQRDEVVRSVWPASFIGHFQTFTDLSKARNERIKRLIPEPVGTPKHFNFCTGVVAPGGSYASSEIMKLELESVARMGINTLYGSAPRWPRILGLGDKFADRYYNAGASPATYWVGHPCPNHPSVPTVADQVMKSGAEALVKCTEDPQAGAHVFASKIGDEIGVAVNGNHIDTCDDCQHRFRRFLADEKFDPARFGRTWQDIRWTSRVEATDEFSRLLHYYSVLFLSANTAYLHRELVQGGLRYYSPTVPIGYNVNPTPIMGGMGLDWFEMERHGGITQQIMEVIGSIQPGGSSFLADLAWGITSRRKLSMAIYCLYVGPHRTAWDTVAFAARGCRSFIYYNYGPRTLGAPDNFSESDACILGVAEATRPLIAAEDFIVGAVRPPRQAAMIYSRTAEIWDDDNAVVHNRPYIYLGLDHSQIPTDIVSEWDVLDGRLEGYRIAYLSGVHLRRDVAERLRDWVQQGGHLWADVGAAMRDEADNRLGVLEPVFGAKQKLVERKYPVNFGYYLAVTPDADLGKIAWDAGPWGKGGETQCVLQRAIIEPAGGRTLARFEDGLPAAVANDFGKGKALLLAYPAGLVYSRFYREPKRTEPLRFDALDRAVIAEPALAAGVERPVILSTPGIEATRLDSPHGTAVALIDLWLQKPSVTVELRMEKKPTHVESVKSGDIPFKHADGRLSFHLAFEYLDVVTIR